MYNCRKLRSLLINSIQSNKKIVHTGKSALASIVGRPEKKTAKIDKQLFRMSKGNPYLSSKITTNLEEAGKVNISSSIVRRLLEAD